MIRSCSRVLLVAPICLLVLPVFLPGGAAHAATRLVNNCNNSGTGSLRAAVASAISGDTIDLRSLSCSRILLNGQIEVPQQHLRLLGPGRFALTLDGNAAGRVFNHTSSGTLFIYRMSITNGRVVSSSSTPAEGGCIFSFGTVELRRSRLHHCEAYAPEYTTDAAAGGGIRAVNVVLNYSSVFSNKAGTYGFGGGISARTARLYHSQVYDHAVTGDGGGIDAADVSATYSRIHDNSAYRGGGINCGRLTLNKSTVYNNRAVLREFLGGNMENEAGGVRVEGSGHSRVIDSTISGNRAFNYSAGVFRNGTVSIYNSTITRNTEDFPGGAGYLPPEYYGRGALFATTLKLESSILAGNRRTTGTPAYDVAPGTTLTGSHDLISHSQVPVPADTLLFDDPRVAALAYYGGETRTHMLLADSPARDRGSNVLGLEYDQRGPGFPRVKGTATDIGSVER